MISTLTNTAGDFVKKIILTSLAISLLAQVALADKLVFLETPEKSLKARADFIQTAQSTIDAQYFTVENDHISMASLALLKDAAKRGVKVRILIDSMHNLMLRETMAAVLLTHLNDSKSNIHIREYNQFSLLHPFRYTKRMHDKGLIVDNKVLISGGRNVGNGYYGLKNTDNQNLTVFEDSDALVIESPAILQASKYFSDLWNSKFVDDVQLYDYSKNSLESTYCYRNDHDSSCDYQRERRLKKVIAQEKALDALIEDYKNDRLPTKSALTNWNSLAMEVKNVDYLFDDPTKQKRNLKKPENSIADQLYRAIAKAEKSVTIVTPYFVVTPEQENLFATLQQKGVHVRIITNSVYSNDVPAAHEGYVRTRNLALKYDVKIWEYNGPDTLHAKLVLIDREYLYIGSFNWDYRSQNLNREVGILAQLPDTERNDLTNDVYMKFSRIIQRSTPLGQPHRMNMDAGDLSENELKQLAEQIRSANNDRLLWKILFPVIKKQL